MPRLYAQEAFLSMIINKYTCAAAPRQVPERIHFQNAVSRAAKAARQTKHIMSQHQLQEFLSFKLAAYDTSFHRDSDNITMIFRIVILTLSNYINCLNVEQIKLLAVVHIGQIVHIELIRITAAKAFPPNTLN